MIRGGAIGDFILTLPVLHTLRDAYPNACIELLGYPHIAALAENRFYVNAVRSIEDGSLSQFFVRDGDPPPNLRSHFGGFDLVLSYLFDPEGIFEANLRRCGVTRFIPGPAKIDSLSHAAKQLAEPLATLGLRPENLAAVVCPSPEDRQSSDRFLAGAAEPIVAFHPGSGSDSKNWPLSNWVRLGNDLLESATLVVVGGEADEDRVRELRSEWDGKRVLFAKNLSLPVLAAVLERTTFIGHDSGISHLAAAAGAPCVLLFGPTDPETWAPQNAQVRVIRAADRKIDSIQVSEVREAVGQMRAHRANGAGACQ